MGGLRVSILNEEGGPGQKSAFGHMAGSLNFLRLFAEHCWGHEVLPTLCLGLLLECPCGESMALFFLSCQEGGSNIS